MENNGLVEIFKIPKSWEIRLILLIALLLAGALLFWVFGAKSAPAWQGITPAKTSKAELIQVLGEPAKSQEKGRFTIYGYKSAEKFRFHEVWLEEDKVVLIREQVASGEKLKLADLEKKYGKPTTLYSELFAQSQELLTFARRGYAVLANKNNEAVYEVWYFEPTSPQGLVSLLRGELDLTLQKR